MLRGAAIAAVLAGAGATHAADGPTLLVAAYEAPAPCPARAGFLARVLVRTARAEVTTIGDATLRVEVTIAAQVSGYQGRLWIAPDGEDGTERVVTAVSCAEVVDALALVVALTLDPYADSAPLSSEAVAAVEEAVAATLSSSPGEPKPLPTVPAGPDATNREPRPAAPSPAPARRHRAPRPPHADVPPRADAATPPSRLATGVAFELDGAPAPAPTEPMPALRVFGDLALARGRATPSVGLSVAVGREEAATALASTELTWVTARADLCPVGLVEERWLTLRPCLGLGAGALHANPRPRAPGSIDGAHAATIPWLEASGLLRADLTPTRRLLLRLEAGAVVPMLSGTGFEFSGEPEPYPVLDVPALSYVAGAGIGVRW